MSCSKIDEGIYQGGITVEFPADVVAVLDLKTHQDVLFPYAFKAYLWLPVVDGPDFPGVDWLKVAVSFIDQCRKVGWGVLIHCRAGVSRSGMVDVAYHMYKNNWTRNKALDFVCSKRPETYPNPAFMEGLLKYQEYLQQTNH